MAKTVQRVLTFRASSVGDCLMGKYFLENVHTLYPEARCAIVVAGHGDLISNLCLAYPWLEVIEVNRRHPLRLLRFVLRWWGSDIVLTQYTGKPGGRFSLASKLVARLIARRGGLIGFVDASPITPVIYDKLIVFSRDTAPAELERKALRAARLNVSLPTPTLTVISNTVQDIPAPYILVHLFAGNRGRGLHPDKKHELLIALAKEMPNMHFVVTGGKGDRDEALAIAKELPVVVVAGSTTMQEFANLMIQSVGVVSIDTGAAHMTAQLRKPLVVLATCLGLHWWGKEQYGTGSLIRVFTHPHEGTHVYEDYPDCINKVDMQAAVLSARQFLLA